ncbi:hypothetical protein [Marinitoga lauensis]|uniref:hypothetical protein n=1 Tax=Marinitoga lauensis TaxID=2201189 RepID=UPI001F0D148C|nr:hypothetical protein [Marinitoga lauensis]
MVIKRGENIFSISSNNILEVINKPKIISNKIAYRNKLLEIIDYGEGEINIAVITKDYRAVIVDEIMGHFEAFVVPYNIEKIVKYLVLQKIFILFLFR